MKEWSFVPHIHAGHIYLFKSYKGIRGSAEGEDGEVRGRLFLVKDVVTFEAKVCEDLGKVFEDCVDDYLQTCKQLGKLPDT